MITNVIKVNPESIEFSDNSILYSYHEPDCCENHYLWFKDLTIDDFKDLLFDLSNDNFFKKIEGYGIELIPIKGFSVKIPAYGNNNGYYSTNLKLIVEGNGIKKEYAITKCQEITED